MKKDFVLTFATQLIVLISGLLVFKLSKSHFGDIGFAEFSLLKRNLAYVYSLILLGMSVAVPRYIALEIGKNSKDESNVFLASFIIIIASLFVLGIVLFIFGKHIFFVLFGDNAYVKFILPFYISLVALLLNVLGYSYFRGMMMFKNANYLQIISIGIIPLLIFSFAKNVYEIYLYTGLSILSVSLLALLYIIIRSNFAISKTVSFVPKLIIYGIQRLPGDFAHASFFALPVIFAGHQGNVLVAGYVAFSISLLSLSGQVVAPVGLIMLPKISELIGLKKYAHISIYVKKLLFFSVSISVFGTIIYQFFADSILSIYLGHVDAKLIDVSKNIMFGALFYPIYVSMRSVVDAYHTKAYNSISAIVSLALFIAIYYVLNTIYISLIIALFVMSIMTLFFIRKLIFWKENV